jgi:hypothetical protein
MYRQTSLPQTYIGVRFLEGWMASQSDEDKIPTATGKSTSRDELDGLVENMELTLISIIQGVAL